jgi:hypothetical protein
MSVKERKLPYPIKNRVNNMIYSNGIKPKKDSRGRNIIDKELMEKLISCAKREKSRIFLQNCSSILFGNYEYNDNYRANSKWGKDAIALGLDKSYFWITKYHYVNTYRCKGFHKFRYYVFLGKGNEPKGFQKYVSMCNEMGSELMDIYYKHENLFEVCRIMNPNIKPKEINTMAIALRNYMNVARTGYRPKIFNRVRKLLKRYRNNYDNK